jgi:Asp-tRNA(Asn)/Glu-tRNA(Gln) amidotransferase A subunit family amidase
METSLPRTPDYSFQTNHHHHHRQPIMASTPKLQAQLKAKQAVLQAHPDIFCSLPAISKEQERQIALVHTAGSVAQAVASGELAATDVLAACIKRTHFLGKQRLNAISEEGLYEEAWRQAQAIDAGTVKSGHENALSSSSPTTSTHTPTKSKGLVRTALNRFSKSAAIPGTTDDCPPSQLLLGVPVSIKDHIDVKGVDSTIGLIARAGLPKAEDALAVELLRDAGAIIYAKTTNPQACLIYETDSNVFGTNGTVRRKECS